MFSLSLHQCEQFYYRQNYERFIQLIDHCKLIAQQLREDLKNKQNPIKQEILSQKTEIPMEPPMLTEWDIQMLLQLQAMLNETPELKETKEYMEYIES